MKFSYSFQLLFGIFGLSIVLLAGMLYYTFTQSQTLMISHLKSQERLTLQNIAHTITLDMEQLAQETTFLSQLGVMDDLLAEDIDKRILKLLEAKKETLKFHTDFKVKDLNHTLVAATTLEPFNKTTGLLFERTIFASFDKSQPLGYVQLYLPLAYLGGYLEGHPHIYLKMQKEEAKSVDNLALFHLSSDIALANGQGLSLHTLVPKSHLEDQLFSLKQNLVIVALLVLSLLFLAAFLLSRSMAKPIRRLRDLMHQVSQRQAYHLRSDMRRSDEIGYLSQSFNTLLEIIEQKISHIQAESENRMQQFTDLVESFNRITTQQDALGVDHALHEVRLFAKSHQGSTDAFLEAVETLATLQHERITLQNTQIRLLEEATRLAQSRSDFITQVSHEFKTPLNSIIGFSQFIDQEKLLPKEYHTLASNIEKAGKHLLSLVNQILEVSQKDLQNTTIDLHKIHLNNLLQEVCELLQPQSQKMGMKIRFKPSLSYIIQTDRRMLKQVFINLLANAIKFSNHKDVILWVSQAEQEIMIHFKDSGIGMKEASLSQLFTPFVRLENANDIKGTGLGLALAQSYMHKLSGKIIARSEGLNQGSEFIIKVDKAICVSC
ncbi:MAG: HAMP domain-containing protein [Epsilonproteobacteria bacterium]|nr:HAMP domain-containing protein [Campylobacterota bacterium]